MKVQLELGGALRVLANGTLPSSVEILEGASLLDLLTLLGTQYPEVLNPWFGSESRPKPGMLVFVNDAQLSAFEGFRLHAGDRVCLMPLISGG